MTSAVGDDVAALIKDGLKWRRQITEERERQARAVDDWIYSDSARARRTLVSDLPCGLCGRLVIVVHPLPDWAFALLPNTDWVRCGACEVPHAV